FSSHKFEYDFPKGIEKLMASNSIIAINAKDWEFDTIIDLDKVEQNRQAITSTLSVDGKSVSSQIHFKGTEDDLLLLNHADFTMICSNCQGDYQTYPWKHIISVPMSSGGEKEFNIWMESTKVSNKMIFQLRQPEVASEQNKLIDIGQIPIHHKP
ncbi:MAG: hypothetical protein AAFV95_25695, partial [Bacteroidota bacterium]